MENIDVAVGGAPAAYAPVNTAHQVMNAIFDLSSAEDVESAEIQLKRNGQPLPIFVTLAGPEHSKRKVFALNKQRRARKELAKTGKLSFADPIEDEAEQKELLADCTLSWRTEYKDANGKTQSVPYVLFEGKQYTANRTDVLALLDDPKRAWFHRSMQGAFDDGEAFIKVSASV